MKCQIYGLFWFFFSLLAAQANWPVRLFACFVFLPTNNNKTTTTTTTTTTEVPSLRHKDRLPITRAVITEVFRFRPTSALGAPRRVARDTLLAGYLIPKGSLLLSNIFAANSDPKLWRQPDEFDPGRFLDDKGRSHIPQRILTFSTGR